VRTAKLCPRDDILMRSVETSLTPSADAASSPSSNVGGLTVLPPLNASSSPERAPKYRLMLYQRDLTRRLLDHDAALRELQRGLGSDWSIEVCQAGYIDVYMCIRRFVGLVGYM
jgi:hypothetical protein